MRTRVVAVAALIVLGGCVSVVPGTTTETGPQTGPATTVTAPPRNTTATPARETTTGTMALPSTAPAPTVTGGQSWTVTVVEVIDGDTMRVSYANGTRETIRLLGVDTPEPYATVTPDEWRGIPDTTAGRAWLRGWADNASTFARDRLVGREVRIVTDPVAGHRGRYGRLLVYLVVDGNVFGERLLRKGYARVYETEFSLYSRFSTAESRAKAADRGVWGFETD